jgi:xanthine dehydrogenase/oxidase
LFFLKSEFFLVYSLNGLIDIGQAEGAFAIGLGFFFLEKIRYDPENGRCLTEGTWDYLPPLVKDMPVDFRVAFIEDSPNPVGVLGAKCVGEPPLVLSVSALFACRRAIEAARLEIGVTGHFDLDTPVTPERIQSLCLTKFINFNL